MIGFIPVLIGWFYLADARPYIRLNKRSSPISHRQERSFISLFVSFFFFQGFSTIIFDRDFSPNLSFSLSFRSFIGIRRFKRLEFHLEALFLFNQLEQDFGTVKFDFSPD